MNWFRRPSPQYINITKATKPEEAVAVPKDLWHKCTKCGVLTLRRDFEANQSVCPACNKHERLSARARIRFLVDEGTFSETHGDLTAADPLEFVAKVPYPEYIAQQTRKAGENEAVLTGTAEIGGVRSSLAIMDFNFMGGSMGSVVGEKITRAMEQSLAEQIPCITLTSSGGARMQEGILSLMQMAKTSILCAEMQEAGVPFVSILADPATGGTMASFASLGDIILAEPGAIVGFAGKRVIEQTIKQQLPPDFQTAEFQREHGFVDRVVERKNLRGELIRLLRLMTGLPAYHESAEPADREVTTITAS